jgi:hypothetical protein
MHQPVVHTCLIQQIKFPWVNTQAALLQSCLQKGNGQVLESMDVTIAVTHATRVNKL